jgi:hypothetical protein
VNSINQVIGVAFQSLSDEDIENIGTYFVIIITSFILCFLFVCPFFQVPSSHSVHIVFRLPFLLFPSSIFPSISYSHPTQLTSHNSSITMLTTYVVPVNVIDHSSLPSFIPHLSLSSFLSSLLRSSHPPHLTFSSFLSSLPPFLSSHTHTHIHSTLTIEFLHHNTSGYVVPVNVINHFLDDVARHGRYSGVCGLGVRLQPMENEKLRTHFKMVRWCVLCDVA